MKLKGAVDVLTFRDLTAVFCRIVPVIVSASLTLVAIGDSMAFAQGQKGPLQRFDLSEDYVTVRFGPDSSLRAMAEEYLDDPDLWPIILRLNGLKDITDIEVDQELRLPASQLQAAVEALAASLSVIQAANEAGAQLFAPLLIGRAISLHEDALKEKQAGAFSQSITLSTQSIDRAQSARAKSDELRDIEAEARLSDRHGRVEGQKTTENSWSGRNLNAVLNEQEKLRTLSESTAQVVFRDASRLRLNPNSQAVIQRMRVDPLKRREEAQISLIEGDFYALLATESKRNRLEVNLPNADATIDSGSFWVSQDDDAAKFSNYDVKPVSITARGETLVLGRNEGALVPTGEAPQEKVSVHRRIALQTPEDEAKLFGNRVDLNWEAGDGAGQYWIEVAHDGRFDRLAETLWGIEENSIKDLEIEPGVYYWRVAAIDAFGLPGQMSAVRRFEIRNDTAPPFLRVLTPEADTIVREARLDVSGETEPLAEILINGAPVPVDAEGRFSHAVPASEGENEVTLVAIDPAGNETVRKIQFEYLADAERAIAYSESLVRDDRGRFLTAGDALTLSGKAEGEARISVLDRDGKLRSETYAEPTGEFLVNVPLEADEETLTVKSTAVSGHTYEEMIDVAVVDTAPRIRFAEPPPAVTSEPELALEVLIDQPSALVVNGKPVDMANGQALANIALSEGPNLIETVATNAVGLVSIDKRTVILDSEKPVVTSQSATLEPSGNSTILSLTIGAKDAAGVAKTSRYRVLVNGQEIEGVLRYNRARKAYRGQADIPMQAGDGEVTIEIEIADIAGNVSVVNMVQ